MAVLEAVKKEIKGEHGGENCPRTDLQIESNHNLDFKFHHPLCMP